MLTSPNVRGAPLVSFMRTVRIVRGDTPSDLDAAERIRMYRACSAAPSGTLMTDVTISGFLLGENNRISACVFEGTLSKVRAWPRPSR